MGHLCGSSGAALAGPGVGAARPRRGEFDDTGDDALGVEAVGFDLDGVVARRVMGATARDASIDRGAAYLPGRWCTPRQFEPRAGGRAPRRWR